MEASEGSSWARDWHGFVQKLKSGTATLSEFEQLDKLELLNHGRKYKKKAQDHAGSQCFVCRCTLDPAFALAWTSDRTICLWCQAWDDKDKEEMHLIDAGAIEEEISKISCHLEELENKSSSPGIKTPFNGVPEFHHPMSFSEFERLDSVDRHQTCTCKKLVCTCITPEPSETDGETNLITSDLSASGFLPQAHQVCQHASGRGQASEKKKDRSGHSSSARPSTARDQLRSSRNHLFARQRQLACKRHRQSKQELTWSSVRGGSTSLRYHQHRRLRRRRRATSSQHSSFLSQPTSTLGRQHRAAPQHHRASSHNRASSHHRNRSQHRA